MIIVDTNVVSELLRSVPDARVAEWATHNSADLAASVVTVQELTFGIQRMADGARRTGSERAVDTFVSTFENRILHFTVDAARMTGVVLATRFSAGRPTSVQDAQIAGTALVHGAAIATRNIKDFDGLGIELVNPWSDSRS